MSYEIIYDKQFIKVAENKFIPFLFAGSNNCTEWSPSGRERRVRSWSSFIINDGGVVTREELIAYVDKTVESCVGGYENSTKEDVENRLLSHMAWQIGNKNSSKDLKNFFNTACNKAITIGQAREINYGVAIHADDTGYAEKFDKEIHKEPVFYSVEHGSDFIETYNKLKKDYKRVRVVLERADDNFGIKARKRFFPRKKKNEGRETEVVSEFFTIMVDNVYFSKNTARGYRYGFSPIKKYRTKKEAENVIKRMNRTNPRDYSVVKRSGVAYLPV